MSFGLKNLLTINNLRFKTIYNFAHYVVENEIRDVHFNSEEDYFQIRDCRTYRYPNFCWKRGFRLSKFEGVCEAGVHKFEPAHWLGDAISS